MAELVDLAAALQAFIDAASRMAAPLEIGDVEPHIRHPTTPGGIFRGSGFGQKIWESGEGAELQRALFEVPELRQRFEPPPDARLHELRGRVASFVASIRSASSRPRVQFQEVERLVAELTGPATARSAWLVSGLSLPHGPISLGQGLDIVPATDDAVRPIAAATGFEGGLVSVPRAADALIWDYHRVDEPQFAFPATSALAFSGIRMQRILQAIWLVTGVRPVVVMKYHSEEARFPAHLPFVERVVPESVQLPPWAPVTPNGQHVGEVLLRTGDSPWETDPAFDDETALALRAASWALESGHRFADSGLAALSCYAMADGLLSDRDEDDAVSVKRIAALLGENDDAKRALRRKLQALYLLRSDVAHGRRPDAETLFKFLGDARDPQNISDQEFQRALDKFQWVVRDLMRAIYGCFVWLTVEVSEDARTGEPTVRPGSSRGDILDAFRALETSADESFQEELARRLPSWLRAGSLPALKL